MRRETLLKEYAEVGSGFRLLTDIRFKLLAFLPIAAAAAAGLKADSVGPEAFALSLFGLVVTLGLATYNARNDQLYDELVGRAAAIERSLGLPDGAFANRPRAWLSIPIHSRRWSVDHRNGVTTIYAASAALWIYGLLLPALDLLRRIYLTVGLPSVSVKEPELALSPVALVLAVGATVLGLKIFRKHKRAQEQALRAWAAQAVNMARGLTIQSIVKNENLLGLCASLSSSSIETVRAKASFYEQVDPDSIRYYVLSGSPEVMASHYIALLTDLPARWLFDCATNRRGTLDAPPAARMSENQKTIASSEST